MVVGVTEEYERDIAGAAMFASVVLAGAHLPTAIIIYVGFPRWVMVAYRSWWEDRNGVLEVGDAVKVNQVFFDKIGEVFVSDLKGEHNDVREGREE